MESNPVFKKMNEKEQEVVITNAWEQEERFILLDIQIASEVQKKLRKRTTKNDFFYL